MAGCSGGGGGGGSSSGGSGSGTDTTAPTVISTSPATNATGVDVNTTINVTFSETMNPLTVNKFNFTLSQGANSVSGTVTYSGTTATFTPSANLAYETTYAATITAGVKDLAGTAMALNYTWTFSTSSPRIASINISGAHLLAMAVYEGGNRIFVADDDSESLHVIDGGTNQIIATIPNVGGAVFQIAVNETYGKVYVASDKQCCTTGITPNY
jgi:YVTN family beta-propeller protein